MKRLTLEDIGKLAGVSRATVSRVVNGYPHIRPDVRQRVEKVIAETGFRPNVVARTLASNRSNIIGLIVPSIVHDMFSDPYFPILIEGVTTESSRQKQIVSLYLMDNLYKEKDLAENIIRTGFLDGIILVLGQYDLRHLSSAASIPFVTIGKPRDADFVPFVDADNFNGGYLATKHLLELGHRRIGIIAVSSHTSGEQRLQGYRHALAEYGVEFDTDLCAEGDFSIKSAYTAAERLIPYQPTAIFASSDRMALGAVERLRAFGVRVPEEVAVVGFDDLAPALTAVPPLTTIHQDVFALGTNAVRLLLDVINTPQAVNRSITLPTELVIRESCGARLYQGHKD